MNLTPMTELDAVNLMLSVIGEAPVNSLNVSGLGDVATASAILQETSRQVQERGWMFNVEDDVSLPLSVDGFIYVPSNTLRIVLEGSQDADITQRGNRIYDRAGHTFVFSKALTFQITYMLAYDELPQAARHYVALKAARTFQKRSIASDQLEKFTQEDELLALAQLQDADTDGTGYNMLTGNAQIAMIHVR